MQCNKESDKKEYDCTEDYIKKVMVKGQLMLKLPQHWVCTGCGGLKTVKLIKESKDGKN
jgi:hypothetical protein